MSEIYLKSRLPRQTQIRRTVSAVSVGGQCLRDLRDHLFALSALSCSTLLLWRPAILSSRHRRRDLHFALRAASQDKKCPL